MTDAPDIAQAPAPDATAAPVLEVADLRTWFDTQIGRAHV